MYQTYQQRMNDVWAFGMSLMLMGIMFALVRSLLTTALKSEKETPELLPQTARGKSEITSGYRAQARKVGEAAIRDSINWNGTGKDSWDAAHPYASEYEGLADVFATKTRLSYGEWQWKVFKGGRVYKQGTESSSQGANQRVVNVFTDLMGNHGTPSGKRPRLLGKSISQQITPLLTQVTIEGGEPVPSQYRYLADWVSEPLPEYSLQVLPATVPEVGERKIDAVLKQLKDGVESIQESDKFRLFLSTMARFHDYSIGNLILIAIQKPAATHVAGFNTWKDLGRWVRAGEKGIAILAPVMPPRPTCPKCGSRLPKGVRFCPQCGEEVEVEEEIGITPRYFKVVYVFDISQTEGKPLPEFEVPTLTGEANEELFSRVMALAKAQGLDVSFEPRPGQDPSIKGQYFGKSIWVRPEETRAQQLKTLIHEVAHYYSEGVFRIPTRDAETIAESAAFAIGAHFGFDTGVRSFPYVALWAQDKKVLEQNLAGIRRVANQIIESLGQKKSF